MRRLPLQPTSDSWDLASLKWGWGYGRQDTVGYSTRDSSLVIGRLWLVLSSSSSCRSLLVCSKRITAHCSQCLVVGIVSCCNVGYSRYGRTSDYGNLPYPQRRLCCLVPWGSCLPLLLLHLPPPSYLHQTHPLQQPPAFDSWDRG